MKKLVAALCIAIFFLLSAPALADQLKVMGDTNGDQFVDPRDALFSLQVSAKLRPTPSGVYQKIKLRLSAPGKDITFFPVSFGAVFSQAGAYTSTVVLSQPVNLPEILTVYPGEYLLGFNFLDNISGQYLVGGQGVVSPWSFQLEITNKTGSTVLLSLNQANRFVWRDNGYGGGNIWTAIHVGEGGEISLSPNAPFLSGDGDGDNKVDLRDAVMGLQICSGYKISPAYPDFYNLQFSLSAPGRSVTHVPALLGGQSVQLGGWNSQNILPEPIMSAAVAIEPGDYTIVSLVLNFRDQVSGQYLVGGAGFVQDWDFVIQILVNGRSVISFNQDDRWIWRDNGYQGGDLVISFRLNRDGTAVKI